MLSISELFGLSGRTALVTGASRGIGRAIALGFAQAGADVAVLARNTCALEALADEIESHGQRAVIVTCDLTDRQATSDAVARVLAEFGQVDVLVNNAGGFEHAAPFVDLEPADWTAVLRLNLESVVHLCQELGRHFVRRGSGSVINLSSIAGLGGVPMMSTYAAAKAALLSLTKSLAAEWAGSGVRVNALTPGWIETDLTRTFTGDETVSEGVLSAVPAGRWGTPEDVVGAAVFLAAEASRLVTGSCLVVDGGTTAYVGGPAMLRLLELGRVPA